MRDRRVLQLEGQLEGAKEQNNLLRAQLDGLSMKSTAPTYTMCASPGQRVWRELLPPAGTAIRMPHTQVGPPYPSAFPTSPETQAVIFKCCGTVTWTGQMGNGRMEDCTFTNFLTRDAAEDDWCQQFQLKASLLQSGLRTLFPSGMALPLTPVCIPCTWFSVKKEEDMPRVLKGIEVAVKELVDTMHRKYGMVAGLSEIKAS